MKFIGFLCVIYNVAKCTNIFCFISPNMHSLHKVNEQRSCSSMYLQVSSLKLVKDINEIWYWGG